MASGPITSWQIDGETRETVRDFTFLGSKITANGDCSHEIKRCLFLGRKVMTNLDSVLKSRDITLPIKVCLVKAMDFPVVMYGCESWTIKKAERRRIDAFELWCWISLQSKRLSRLFSNTTIQKQQFFSAQLSFQHSHPYMTTGKTIALTRWTFVGKVMSLIFNMLSRLVITFLPRSKHLLISQLQSPSALILELPKIKSLTVFIVSPSICREVMGPDAMILVF